MNNPPWLDILEAHSQTHEAWWVAFGLKEKGIMSTPPTAPPDDPEMECFNLDCGWHGPLSECLYIVNVSPSTCPQCRETTAVITGSPRPAAVASAQWQQIETAPEDAEVLFWIRPKTAEETYHNSYGEPLLMSGEAGARICKFRCWGALEIATHWMPLPAAPAMLGSHQPEDSAS